MADRFRLVVALKTLLLLEAVHFSTQQHPELKGIRSMGELLNYEKIHCDGDAETPRVVTVCTTWVTENLQTSGPSSYHSMRPRDVEDFNVILVCFQPNLLLPNPTTDGCLRAISVFYSIMPKLLASQYPLVNIFINSSIANQLMAAMEMMYRVPAGLAIISMIHQISVVFRWKEDDIFIRFGHLIESETTDTAHAKKLLKFLIKRFGLMNSNGKIAVLIEACLDEMLKKSPNNPAYLVTVDRSSWSIFGYSIMEIVTSYVNYPLDLSPHSAEILAQTIRLALQNRVTVIIDESYVDFARQEISNDDLEDLLRQSTYDDDIAFEYATRPLHTATWRIFHILGVIGRGYHERFQKVLADQYAADIVHSMARNSMSRRLQAELTDYISLLLQVCMRFEDAC